MPQKISQEEQTVRFYRRRKRERLWSVLFSLFVRTAAVIVTAICIYLVFVEDDAMKVKEFAAAALAVLLYAQCASLSLVGLRLFSKSMVSQKRQLAQSSVLLCAPLYFVVLVISIIPLTERAAFFITVFPAAVLNILPMESIRDEMVLRDFPSWLFWMIQIAMQMLCFAGGQMYGQHLMVMWG